MRQFDATSKTTLRLFCDCDVYCGSVSSEDIARFLRSIPNLISEMSNFDTVGFLSR